MQGFFNYKYTDKSYQSIYLYTPTFGRSLRMIFDREIMAWEIDLRTIYFLVGPRTLAIQL